MAITHTALSRNICFGSYFFLLGVEYAVILPTINGYLITLDADNTFLGIILASFSFAGLLTAPIFGYFTDKTRAARACIVVGNLLEIAGNFMYFVGRSKYFVLFGRVIAGFGSGASSSVFGTISRSTTEKERTSTFALLMGLRQIGLLIGPGFNAFLHALNFSLGPFVVDEHSSPGLFMVLLWVLHTILFISLYKDTQGSVLSDEHSNGIVNASVNTSIRGSDENSDHVVITKTVLKEFLREEVVVILAASFLAMFVQTGIEAAITPLTLMYFGWHGLSNSYLLLAVGVVVLFGFLGVHFCSKRYADRALLLFGSIGLATGYAALLVGVVILYYNDIDPTESPSWLFPAFCLDVLVWVLSLPFMFVPQLSLFSKLTSAETQGFNQGVRLIAVRIGMILGPLWASPMVTESRLPIMASVNLTVLCVLVAMIIGSYGRLLPPSLPQNLESSQDEPSESSPLLIEA